MQEGRRGGGEEVRRRRRAGPGPVHMLLGLSLEPGSPALTTHGSANMPLDVPSPRCLPRQPCSTLTRPNVGLCAQSLTPHPTSVQCHPGSCSPHT